MSTSRQFRLASRPVGELKASDLELVEAPAPEAGDGEFVIEVTHISLDPAMRGWMSAARSYVPPVEIGEVMRALTLGRVIDSRHPRYAAGELVHGTLGVQEHAVSDGTGVHKVTAGDGISLPAYLGVLGMTGLTAYFGLLDVGRLQEGDTVLVSGAAGAVGTTVGQIAKIKGARAVGIAGGQEKCRILVDDLGFDAAIDYKAGDLRGQLRQHTPRHVDVFFDNVGGDILDQGLTRLGRGARVVICGAVSQYNATEDFAGPSNYMMLLVTRSSMTGFVVFDYAERYAAAAEQLASWLADGRLSSVEDTVRADITAFPNTLARLFASENTGKLVQHGTQRPLARGAVPAHKRPAVAVEARTRCVAGGAAMDAAVEVLVPRRPEGVGGPVTVELARPLDPHQRAVNGREAEEFRAHAREPGLDQRGSERVFEHEVDRAGPEAELREAVVVGLERGVAGTSIEPPDEQERGERAAQRRLLGLGQVAVEVLGPVEVARRLDRVHLALFVRRPCVGPAGRCRVLRVAPPGHLVPIALRPGELGIGFGQSLKGRRGQAVDPLLHQPLVQVCEPNDGVVRRGSPLGACVAVGVRTLSASSAPRCAGSLVSRATPLSRRSEQQQEHSTTSQLSRQHSRRSNEPCSR